MRVLVGDVRCFGRVSLQIVELELGHGRCAVVRSQTFCLLVVNQLEAVVDPRRLLLKLKPDGARSFGHLSRNQ